MRATRTSQKREGSVLTLSLPATSANLGPAFDAAALALRLYLRVSAHVAKEFEVTASGRDTAICGKLEDHLILTTYRDVLAKEGKPPAPLSLTIDNQIPIGKGCGSSAAARLAGIALAVRFGNLDWNDNRIVGEASAREHHPDNAAACWYGGLAVARMCGHVEAQVVKVEPKGKWPLLIVVPPDPLSTEEARRVLPGTYSRIDTVTNVQNSMMLLAALTQGRHDLLANALEDRIHQPYRARLCPLLPTLQPLVGSDGLRGVALSGAGPSILAFLDPETSVEVTVNAVRACLQKKHLEAELLVTAIADKGARDTSIWKRKQTTQKRMPAE
jgi:homoserine kinase